MGGLDGTGVLLEDFASGPASAAEGSGVLGLGDSSYALFAHQGSQGSDVSFDDTLNGTSAPPARHFEPSMPKNTTSSAEPTTSTHGQSYASDLPVAAPLYSTLNANAAPARHFRAIAPDTTTLAQPTPPTTTHGTASPLSRTSPSPPSAPADRKRKRERNTEAARRYRQKKVDRTSELEEALSSMTRERDELRLKLARAEAEADVLRGMVGGRGR